MIFDSPVYPVSPSFEDEILELESTQRYIEFLEDNGAKNLMTTAGTSQFNLMTREEIRYFNSTLLGFRGNKIIGIPPISLSELRKEIFYYNQLNIQNGYLLILFPERYYRNEQIIEFFEDVCKRSKYPVLVHGNTLKKGFGGEFVYDYKLIESLSRIKGFVGMKEESPTIDFSIKNLSGEFGLEVIVAGGSMRRFWALEPFGATTYLTGVGSFNPAIEEDFYRSYMNGDMKWSKDIMTEIEKPFFETFMKIGWHASMRYALNQMGYIKGNRDPFYNPNEGEKEQIKKALEKITK